VFGRKLIIESRLFHKNLHLLLPAKPIPSRSVLSFMMPKTVGSWDELACPACGALNFVVLEGEGLYITRICDGCGKEVEFTKDPWSGKNASLMQGVEPI
jgi:hypothetical protein